MTEKDLLADYPKSIALTKKAVGAATIRVHKELENFPTWSQAFIDGESRPAISGETFPSVNPALSLLTNIARCSAADVDVAVAASKRSFESGEWSRASPGERKRVLLRFAELIEAHVVQLAILDVLESGKPISDTIEGDLPEAVTCFRYHAEAIDKTFGYVAPAPAGVAATIVREPIGVVACIVPWNFPCLMAAWKVAPALATGNSVILKPAELSSLSAIRLGMLAAEAGIPKGVFNVVPGLGEEAGKALGLHPHVNMCAFTGSTEVGRYFLEYSAKSNMKRITLECGGKSPQVVLSDITAADIPGIAESIASAAFWNMGENCSCGSRLIVREELADALADAVHDVVKGWPVGDPLDPATKFGPLVEQAAKDKVLRYIELGRQSGARMLGSPPPPSEGHLYVAPILFVGVRNSDAIAQEEIFGPVLCVIPVKDDDEAIAVANDTPFGLAASVYTHSLSKAHRASRALRAGTVSVNTFSEGDMTTPFGGFKCSGFVGRDKSIFAHDAYTELKTVWMQVD